MHYMVRLSVSDSGFERVADRGDVYLSPEGGEGWAIVEAEDEESARRDFSDVEDVKPVLPAREYRAIHDARREFEESKARFVDDPSGALSEARRSVGRALEARGYPSAERADEAPEARRNVLRDYHDADPGESGSLEDKRNAFNRLPEILDRAART